MTGKCSIFGGPNDNGMTETEGLAFYWDHDECDKHPELFFPRDPDKRKGTSKRLRPRAYYIALRVDKSERTIKQWRASKWMVSNPANGRFGMAKLVDWGPADWTGRLIDLSPGLAEKLEVKTDDQVIVEEVG